MQASPNKEMDQTNGALARMEAPFAGHLQRSADSDRAVGEVGNE
jgi:hypothetical protein